MEAQAQEDYPNSAEDGRVKDINNQARFSLIRKIVKETGVGQFWINEEG